MVLGSSPVAVTTENIFYIIRHISDISYVYIDTCDWTKNWTQDVPGLSFLKILPFGKCNQDYAIKEKNIFAEANFCGFHRFEKINHKIRCMW